MKQKTILAAVISFTLAAAIFFIVTKDENEDKKAIVKPEKQSEHEYKANEHIPAHKDNEEDLKPEVLKDSKELAERFVNLMVPIDPKTSFDLESLEKITTNELFEQLKKNEPRPTLSIYNRKIIEIESYPVDDILPDRKKWNVIAFVTTSDKEGNSEKEQIWYWVSVAKRAGEWKISGYKEGF